MSVRSFVSLVLGRRHAAAAGVLGLLFLAGAAACGDDDSASSGKNDGGPLADGSSGGVDTGPLTDSGSDATKEADAPAGPAPQIIQLSATGHDRFFSITYDAAGNLYASGNKQATTDASEDGVTIVAKITADGKLDTNFGTGGVAQVNLGTGPEASRGVVVQSTGKIVVAGAVFHAGTVAADRDVAIARFNANGTVDNTFGGGGNGIRTLNLSDPDVGGTVFDSEWGLALGPNDTIFVEGSQKSPTAADSDWAIIKLDANGAVDTLYGTAGNGVVTVDIGGYNADARNITVLADGSAIAAGYMRDGLLTTDPVKPVAIKLLPDGTPDPAFGVNGIFNELILPLVTECYALAKQGNNFVTAGYGRANESESTDWLSLRILANGTRDMTFGTNGIARFDLGGQTDNARNVIVLPDNRVLLMGAGRTSATEQNFFLAMMTANGQADTTFGAGGKRSYDLGGPAEQFWGASLSPNGKTVALGGVTGGKDGGNDDSVIFLMPLGN